MQLIIRYKFLFPLMFLIFIISCINQNGTGENYKSKDSNISFNISSLTEDKNYSFEGFKGKPTVLNFWASWCVPCREEMPFLERTWKDLKDKNINIVGINVMDDKNEAIKVLNQYNITYLNLFDSNGKVSRDFGVLGLPATVFIDSEGNIKKLNYGPFLGNQGEESFNNYLGEIL